MARTPSPELQALMQSLVDSIDSRLELVRRDVAAQQEAMIHEVRSMHEATIRAMAELRAAVHRVELALNDPGARDRQATPAVGIARPPVAAGTTLTAVSVTAEPAETLLDLPADAPTHIPTLAEHPFVITPPAPETGPTATATATATDPNPGLDVDRLIALLEQRLDQIDMTSGTTAD